MSKAPEFIAQSLHHYTSEELQILVQGLDDILELGTKPFTVTPELLRENYVTLGQNARNFPTVPRQRQLQYRLDNLLVLGYTDFQACWYTLRSLGYPDAEIERLDPFALRHLFTMYLQADAERFSGFAPQREAAIQAFVEIGFINPGYFRLLVPN